MCMTGVMPDFRPWRRRKQPGLKTPFALPPGRGLDQGLQRRRWRARGSSQGAWRVRARAHLWPPPHLLQLRRQGEKGEAVGAPPLLGASTGMRQVWAPNGAGDPPRAAFPDCRSPEAGTVTAPSWQTSSPTSLSWKPATASANAATSRCAWVCAGLRSWWLGKRRHARPRQGPGLVRGVST